jgi:AraC-like DNA-binding protein
MLSQTISRRAMPQGSPLAHMRDSRCSISEIAYLLGFAGTSSFSRAFKRWTGQTPSQYREGLKHR